MGNSDSSVERFNNYIDGLEKHKVKSYKDQRYGNVTIYKNPQNPKEHILFKEKWANTDTEEMKTDSLISRCREVKNYNLFKLLESGTKQEDHFCTSFNKHYMVFEYNQNTLEKELERKRLLDESERYLSEPEIWYILDTLSKVEKELISLDYVHGDIQPATCHVTASGYIKLLDNTVLNNGDSAYFKCLKNKSYHAILSQNALNLLKSNNEENLLDPVKEDSFAIGVTALCSAVNCDFNRFYNWKNYTVNYIEVNEALEEMRRLGYSSQVIATIQGLVEQDEHKRTDLYQLIDFLEPYAEILRNKELNFNNE